LGGFELGQIEGIPISLFELCNEDALRGCKDGIDKFCLISNVGRVIAMPSDSTEILKAVRLKVFFYMTFLIPIGPEGNVYKF
jgi:hypothetical protein